MTQVPRFGLIDPWQLADSAFPTGGFAHSWGLEAAWQAGDLETDSLPNLLRQLLWQTAYGTLPLVTAAYRSPDRLEALDARAQAFLTNPVANRASRVQGRAFLSTCSRIWPCDALIELERRARATCGHCGPLIGATLAALQVPLPTAQRLVLYQTCRGALAAAVRLGVIGSYHAQRLQHDCVNDLDAVLARCETLEEDDLAQTAPLLDLLQASHDRLYSRLFQS
jgi:urease accessory protein